MDSYTLIAYKSNSEDYCMGHVQQYYNSDLIIHNSLTEDELIKEWVKIESYPLDRGEVGYSVIIYKNGICGFDSFQGEIERGIDDHIMPKMKEEAELIIQLRDAKKIDELYKKEHQKKTKETSDKRELYNKLKEEFGD